MRLGSKALVVSNEEKSRVTWQVGMEKVNESEPLMNASRDFTNDVKTGCALGVRDEPARRLQIAQAASGVEAARVPFGRLCATTGTIVWNAKRKGTRREGIVLLPFF